MCGGTFFCCCSSFGITEHCIGSSKLTMECSFAFKSHVKEKKKWTGEGRSGGIGGKSTLIR